MQYFLPFLFVLSRASQELHTHLNREELLHYFGTSHINQVPSYHFVSPELVQNTQHKSTTDLSKEYLLNAFGVEHHLYLLPYIDLVSSACITQRIRSNNTHLLEPCVQGEELCHYHGYIINHNQSSAAISTCDGLHGIIGLPEHELVIQPIRKQHLNLTGLTSHSHVLYKRSVKKSSFRIKESGKSEEISHTQLKRRRRSAGQYLEIKAVVAPDAAKFHGADTRKFVTTVLNIAAQRYLDASLGYKLYLTLVDMLILEDDQVGLTIVNSAHTLLNNFCQWQKRHHPEDESNPRHADHVLLITKADLESHGDDSNVGLSYKSDMCSKNNKCSVNEDTGLDLGLTIAHELGHSLGMDHDGQGNSCNDGSFIMASSGAGSLKWSSCSAKYLEDFMSSSRSSCLNDAPAGTATNLYNIRDKPGMFYSANKQCQLAMGIEETVYHSDQIDCSSLKCHRGGSLYSLNSPLVDGTECGNRKWCIEGKCVAMGARSPGPIHGGWSSWSPQWTGCSRTCGGGVKIKTRKCNNPEPRYGGRKCQGEEITAILCDVQECQTGQYKFKEEQCSATDNQQYNGRSYHWIPYASASGVHACQLLCRYSGGHIAVPRGSKKYIDGTECQGHSEIGRCVNGKCEDFGCDGHHGSGLKFDKCGVCNGHGNTCREHKGTYNQGSVKKYVTFVTIPRGSTGIEITNLNQFCHLSVQVNGRRLFSENGESVSNSGTYSSHGIVAKYRRQGPEKIEITGPITANVEAQVWRDYGPEYIGTSPDVTYVYNTPTSNSNSVYKWRKTPGSCSQTCGQGWSVPEVNCIQVSNNRPVDDFHCNLHSKPSEARKSCNNKPCPAAWYPGNWQTCSRSCGGGQTTRTVQCMIYQHGNHVPLMESHCRGQRKPETSKSCNVNPCLGVWKAGDWSCCSKTCSKGVKSRQVKCYASHDSSQPISDSKCVTNQKPVEQEICMDKPCDTSLSGTSCKDKKGDCPSYGSDVCYGEYVSWAKENCKEYCGYCVKDPASFKPPPSDDCKDKEDCAAYGANVCKDYQQWSKENCQKTCNYCPVSTCSTTTDHKDEDKSSCSDKVSDCADYEANVCTEYAGWAKENCQKHCNLCSDQKEEHKSSCSDKVSDCADYGANVCTEYAGWAKENCQKHCKLCSGAQDAPVTTQSVVTTRSPSTGSCMDAISDCADYGDNVCTAYGDWAKKNCQKHCKFCQDITTQTPRVDDSGSNTCTDKVQCTEYGASVCTGYAGWAHDNCPKYCNFCTEEAACTDAITDCTDYGKSACQEYGGWAKKNCQKFCNFCGTRKRRSSRLMDGETIPRKGYPRPRPYHLDNNNIKQQTLHGPLSVEQMNKLDHKLPKEPMIEIARDQKTASEPSKKYDSPPKLVPVKLTDRANSQKHINQQRVPVKQRANSQKHINQQAVPVKQSGIDLLRDAFKSYVLAQQSSPITEKMMQNGGKLAPSSKRTDQKSEKDMESDNTSESQAKIFTNNKSNAPEKYFKTVDESNTPIYKDEKQSSPIVELNGKSTVGVMSTEESGNEIELVPTDDVGFVKSNTPITTLQVHSSVNSKTTKLNDKTKAVTENIPKKEGGHLWVVVPDTDAMPLEIVENNNELDQELKVLKKFDENVPRRNIS